METISWGLLTQLGEDVVTGFYRALTQSRVAFCFVAEEDGAPQGFVAGICDWSPVFWQVVRYTWWPLILAFPSLIVSGRLRRLLETGRYTKSKQEGVNAEFLSFGVKEEARGRLWTGTALIHAAMNEFRRRGVLKVRGVVWEQNERALRFFEAVGFKFVSDIEIHPGERSRTVLVDLAPKT